MGRCAFAWVVALGGAALALLSCASPPQGSAAAVIGRPAPLLWHAVPAEPGSGPLYLLGSVHIGTEQMRDLGPEIADAYARADELVVEIDVAELTEAEMSRLIDRYGTIQPPDTLRSRVSEETWQMLEDYANARGIYIESLENFKPWFVSQWIVLSEFEAMGLHTDFGVDRVFLDRAHGAELPVRGLEPVAYQLELFDALPPSLQELMLRDVLVRAERFEQEMAAILGAWARGDEERLLELLFASVDEHPELETFYETVFFERNRTMTADLVRLARDGKTRFVVLGAGHLVGDRGVPALLVLEGYRVERVAGGPAPAAAPGALP